MHAVYVRKVSLYIISEAASSGSCNPPFPPISNLGYLLIIVMKKSTFEVLVGNLTKNLSKLQKTKKKKRESLFTFLLSSTELPSI